MNQEGSNLLQEENFDDNKNIHRKIRICNYDNPISSIRPSGKCFSLSGETVLRH